MLGNPELITIIVAVITATGASLVTGLLTRPKMSAEAKAVSANGEVALSTDARAWAETFRQEATNAVERAKAADTRAAKAERQVQGLVGRIAEAEARCDGMDERLDAFVVYSLTLQQQVRESGGVPATPPGVLRPPL